ncbi:hypothetical protein [Cylindrospermopsis raciborskii]|uniref:hypothetical protein n=1 Tax=Cylindrospermopsis raciborskii TaxID=77022 RepID=UPI0022CAE6AB|nr:hypothetical protein [Cylindrospermopsis raciborskii]MCZ2203059.1 hypothetical protein [Cylindrospermopsis raciborskii PAMP2012]MCZ2207176.1 hypothetical protein [Cylindrospermopsis raciborskii PAMP2011]
MLSALNKFSTRLQTRLKRRGIQISLGPIKDELRKLPYPSSPTAEELAKIEELFVATKNAQFSLAVVDESFEQPLLHQDDSVFENQDSDPTTLSQYRATAIAEAGQNLGFTLSLNEIESIAAELSSESNTLEEDLEAIKVAVKNYINFRTQKTQDKVGELITELRDFYRLRQTENSDRLSGGLQQIVDDMQESRRRFRLQLQTALAVFSVD